MKAFFFFFFCNKHIKNVSASREKVCYCIFIEKLDKIKGKFYDLLDKYQNNPKF